MLRNYSALVVVISSAILVASTNLAAEGKSSGFLFGYWKDATASNSQDTFFSGQAMQKNDLVLAPLAMASTSINPNPKEEANEILKDSQDQVLLADSSPTLKDPEENGGVKIHTVKEGENLGAIAQKNNITINTILWANDIEDIDSIMPGDQLFILPVAGLTYIVKNGDTIDSIAKEYEADRSKIISFNDLPANGELKEKQEIVIPGGQKEVPVQNQDTSSIIDRREYATPSGGTPATSGWKKLEGKAGSGHTFPYGYCTWYVAQRRFVPWGGNAGTWLYQAKIMGYKTGKTPQKGSIMVSSESWWGHVAVVESVEKNTITVSEMNYKGWGKKSTRTISTTSRVIKGYIY
jgi:surface antigen